MLKVLIIDDEIKVCRLIQCLIDWNALGLTVVGTCHDGLLALDCIKETSPDIIITDIRMPGCDGLTLIAETQKLNPAIHFIIISGYGQFDYTRRAIQYGVSDYILKPIKEKELRATLLSIIDKHRSIEDQRQKNEAVYTALTQTQDRIKSNLIKDLFLNRKSIHTFPDIDTINQTYYTNFSLSSFVLISVYLDMHSDSERPMVNSFLSGKILSLLTEEMKNYHDFSASVSGSSIYCLVNDTSDNLKKMYTSLKVVRNSILSLRELFPELHIVLLQSSTKDSLSAVSECFGELTFTLNEKILSGTDAIYLYERLPICNFHLHDFITPTFRIQYLNCAETFQYEQLHYLLHNLAMQLTSSVPVTGAFIFQIYQEVISLFLFNLKQHKITTSPEEISAAWEETFVSFTDIPHAFSFLATEQCRLLEDWRLHHERTQSKAVSAAKKYINEHYAEGLTLDIIGAEIGLNPSYFSSIFKEETGCGFIDYLTDIRITNAKNLLTETDLEIIEIAEQIGFNDLKYFSKCFRKITGLTPVAYRKLFS